MESMGRVEEALGDYLAAVESSPDFASAHYNAARLFSQSGDIQRGAGHLDVALKLAPGLAVDAREDESLGWVLALEGQKRDRRRGSGRRG